MVLAMATEQSDEDKAARLPVGVIAGSTRPGRQSRTVAEWVWRDKRRRFLMQASDGLAVAARQGNAVSIIRSPLRTWSASPVVTAGCRDAMLSWRAGLLAGAPSARRFLLLSVSW